jgi:dGTPase
MLINQEISLAVRPYLGALKDIATRDDQARRRWEEPASLFCLTPYREDARRLRQCFLRRRSGMITQVFPPTCNPGVSTRLTHSNDFVDFSVQAAFCLGLNCPLCEAGGLVHDSGHVVRGHRGEAAIARLSGKPFRHEVFGCLALQHLEFGGQELNLTHQTLSVILNHSRGHGAMTAAGSPEETLGMYADKIAYTLRDLDDFALVAVGRKELSARPHIRELAAALGASHKERFERCLIALVQESAEAGQVSFSTSETAQLFAALRGSMLGQDGIYRAVNPRAGEERLFDAVYEALAEALPDCDPAVAFALLDDREFDRLVGVLLEGRSVTEADLQSLAFWGVRDQIVKGRLDITDPDLDW